MIDTNDIIYPKHICPANTTQSDLLNNLHRVFRKWLGEEYDLDACDATVATAASEKLTGDALWLMLIGGSGNAKTETVSPTAGAGAHITSTIASEGALLSATAKKDKSKTATGGLLRKIGDRGVLVIKDVTSILSADRNIRGQVLAALREVYDGRWERNVGTDGGQSLLWTGRIVVIGAVTTAWDTHHAVVAAMGDRFVNLRLDSTSKSVRRASGMQSIRNTGSEIQMREELAEAVGDVIDAMKTDDVPTTDDENEQLLNAADIVTMARTAVEFDSYGNVIIAHAPEQPTRFAKQLGQMLRGGVAIGMTPERAMQLTMRCARDSIPPLRFEVLLDVAKNPRSPNSDVYRRIDKPRTTVRREMDGLNMLGILKHEEETKTTRNLTEKTTWFYSLADDFDRETLLTMVKEKPKGNGKLY